MIIEQRLGKNTVLNHVIYNELPDNPTTYSSYLLLKNYYRELDVSFSEDNDWRYYFIVRRHFLRKMKKNGHWTCHYCKSPVYKMQKRNTFKQEKGCITIDHIIPVSSGYPMLDTKNMVECCSKCNQKKGNKEYELFIK